MLCARPVAAAVRGVLMTYIFVPAVIALEHPLYVDGCGRCTITVLAGWGFLALQYIWCVKVFAGATAFLRKDKKKAAANKQD